MKTALITGITGQDGSYLAELLLSKGYIVYGVIRRSSSFNTGRIDHIYQDPHEGQPRLRLLYGDLNDASSLNKIIRTAQPTEIYHLGAQSHVRVSFDVPEYTGEITGLGTVRLLEAIRETGVKTRFYHASSSEMFGSSPPPQNEETPFRPRSPYAAAKIYAHWMTVNYREGYGLFACNGILFNHESPRRGETFVTRKITKAAARIKLGRQDKLFLGNLDAKRDWGYAPDYMEAIWLMMQQDQPDDYVIATGETYTVRDFLDEAFNHLGMDWKKYVEIDPRYYRPTEVDVLMGDSSKARKKLNWRPKMKFADLVRVMVDADMKAESEKPASAMASHEFWEGKRVLVTGGSGFLGSRLFASCKPNLQLTIFVPRRKEYDLVEQTNVARVYEDSRPDIVIHAAGEVGGIGANRANPGRFFYNNLMMGVQMMEYARRHGVSKFVAVGTICAYPKFTPVPFKEEDLWNGYPEETNAPYGLAKKMLLVQSRSYREQYGFNSIFLLPVNLYGPADNFDLDTSHAIPAIVRKCVEAMQRNETEVVLWGTGSPTREFLHVEDAAEGILLAAERYNGSEPVNLGSGMEIRFAILRN